MIQQTIFKTYKELQKEINKRDYNNIEGLKAEITKKEFNYFLNVLPPLNWIQTEKENSFLLSECLTGNLYYKFFEENTKFYCVIIEYKLNREELNYFG